MAGTILVVDDEAPIRELLAAVLEESGYRVLQAVHGKQALDLVSRERPDLVLCDVMMPVMNGVELCARLKAATDLPVILMSAAAKRTAAAAARADAFLAKPFDLDLVDMLVSRYLHS